MISRANYLAKAKTIEFHRDASTRVTIFLLKMEIPPITELWEEKSAHGKHDGWLRNKRVLRKVKILHVFPPNKSFSVVCDSEKVLELLQIGLKSPLSLTQASGVPGGIHVSLSDLCSSMF